MLSCDCSFDEEYDDEYWFYPKKEFSTAPWWRAKRCYSCRKLIFFGETVLEFQVSQPNDYGDEIWVASKYFCEWCGEMYLNLDSLGYCFSFPVDMREMIKEYQELTGFKL